MESRNKLKLTELNRPDIPTYKQLDKLPIVVVLDNIRSMSNIGSVFRTSDAFLITEIHLCGITSTPPNKEIHKTALGATDSVAWRYFNETNDSVNLLKNQNYKIISIEQTTNSIMLHHFKPKPGEKYALIFGNEVNGVEQSILNDSDLVLEIPQFGTKHSLNISISMGIVIWDFYLKLKVL
jgi:tRNA G18 (ribose-2'-O)-methylase SpoU